MFLEFIQLGLKKNWLQSDKRLRWKSAVLYLFSISFIKSEVHCRHFAPLFNSEIFVKGIEKTLHCNFLPCLLFVILS